MNPYTTTWNISLISDPPKWRLSYFLTIHENLSIALQRSNLNGLGLKQGQSSYHNGEREITKSSRPRGFAGTYERYSLCAHSVESVERQSQFWQRSNFRSSYPSLRFQRGPGDHSILVIIIDFLLSWMVCQDPVIITTAIFDLHILHGSFFFSPPDEMILNPLPYGKFPGVPSLPVHNTSTTTHEVLFYTRDIAYDISLPKEP